MDAKYFGTYTVGRQVTWAEKCKNAAFRTCRNIIRARGRSQNNENLHVQIINFEVISGKILHPFLRKMQ